eukprot:PhM_4_TR2765/c0_g1_i1/m.89238/K03696/clpC; ATP-dependent Clp protease ATP-binding subunit ClpC
MTFQEKEKAFFRDEYSTCATSIGAIRAAPASLILGHDWMANEWAVFERLFNYDEKSNKIDKASSSSPFDDLHAHQYLTDHDVVTRTALVPGVVAFLELSLRRRSQSKIPLELRSFLSPVLDDGGRGVDDKDATPSYKICMDILRSSVKHVRGITPVSLSALSTYFDRLLVAHQTESESSLIIVYLGAFICVAFAYHFSFTRERRDDSSSLRAFLQHVLSNVSEAHTAKIGHQNVSLRCCGILNSILSSIEAVLPDSIVAVPGDDTTNNNKNPSDPFVGQIAVRNKISEHVRALKSNVAPRTKPLVLWLCGPSGHGKTFIARLLCQELFGAEDAERRFIPLSMPNYATPEASYSLIDPPAAHVGEGILLARLRAVRDAECVVLLDEFEKVQNKTIEDIWLSAFQRDGVLRSLKSSDRNVSTNKTVFIITSNICADTIEKESDLYLSEGSDRRRMVEGWRSECVDTIERRFGKPLANRVDDVLVFVPYSVDERRSFVEKELMALQQYNAHVHKRQVRWTTSVVDVLLAKTRHFHNSVVNKEVRPLLVLAQQKGWSSVIIKSALRLSAECNGCALSVSQWPIQIDDSNATTAESTSTTVSNHGDIVTMSVQPPHVGNQQPQQRELSLELERGTKTERETDLEKEVTRLLELVREKDVEIETLKKRVMSLEILVFVLLMTTLLSTSFIFFVAARMAVTLYMYCLLFGVSLLVLLCARKGMLLTLVRCALSAVVNAVRFLISNSIGSLVALLLWVIVCIVYVFNVEWCTAPC